jgi:DNA invertase Pin-like site-specific DNA recombinase
MTRVALYARVSTSEQAVDLQLDGLRDYARARGFSITQKYIDAGISGANAKRPALDQLLKDAHRRRFDTVLVWKLDRLGRSLSHLIRVVDQLGSLGVDLISLGDPGLDTTGPSGRLIFHVMGAVAEFERGLIRERTKAGVAAARRRGKRLGRPRAYFSQAEALALLSQGRSLSATARALGMPRTTLRRRLEGVTENASTGTPGRGRNGSAADPAFGLA